MGRGASKGVLVNLCIHICIEKDRSMCTASISIGIGKCRAYLRTVCDI